MSDAIALVANAVGEPVLYTPSGVRERAVYFTDPVTVPVERAFDQLDIFLADCGLYRIVLRERPQRVHSIRGDVQNYHPGRPDLPWVTLAELARIPESGACVSLALSLDRLDADAVVHTVCVFLNDSDATSVMQIRGCPTLVMSGPARRLARLAELLLRLDQQAQPQPAQPDLLDERLRRFETAVAQLEAR